MKGFVSALLPHVKAALSRLSSLLLKALGIAFVACLCDATGLASSFGSWSSDTNEDGPTCISSLIATYHSAPCQRLLNELDSALWSISAKSKTEADSATSSSILRKIAALELAPSLCELRMQDVSVALGTSTQYGATGSTP